MIQRLFGLVWILTIPSSWALAQEDFASQFTLSNDSTGKVFEKVGNGFRLKTPVSVPAAPTKSTSPANSVSPASPSNRQWMLDSHFALSGNFEFLVDFDVEMLGVKEGKAPFKSNAQIGLNYFGISGELGINVCHEPQLDKDGPNCFRVVRIEPDQRGMHYNILTFPRKSNQGKIGFRREGSQLIFFAADGKGAELKELVRFPFDSHLEPHLRLSAFQGSGAIAMPVNVLFSGFSVKADRILKGSEIQDQPKSLEEKTSNPVGIDYQGKPSQILADSKKTNDRGTIFQVEGDGLRVKPPAAATHVKGAGFYWFRDFPFELVGDFEISTRFAVKQLGPPGPDGHGAMAVCLVLETEGPLGAINLGRCCTRGAGQCYTITRSYPTSTGKTYESMRFPTKADQGRLIMRRTGEQLELLVQEGDANPVLLFKTFAMMEPTMRLRLLADQGGTNTGIIDLYLSDLVIRANGLLDNGKKVKGNLVVNTPTTGHPGNSPISHLVDAPEPTYPRKWLFVILGLGAFAGLGAAGFFLFRGKPG